MLTLSLLPLDPPTHVSQRMQLLAHNHGTNVIDCYLIELTVIDLLRDTSYGLFLRPPPSTPAWDYPRSIIEPGLGVGIHVLSGIRLFEHVVTAKAHYIEVDKRATL